MLRFILALCLALFVSSCMGADDIVRDGKGMNEATVTVLLSIAEVIKRLVARGFRTDINYYNGIELADGFVINENGYDAHVSLYYLNKDSCGPNFSHAEESGGDFLQNLLAYLIGETETFIVASRYGSLALTYGSVMIKYVTYRSGPHISFAQEVQEKAELNGQYRGPTAMPLATCATMSHNLYSGPVGAVGTTLDIGEEITSTNGEFRLVMQTDCNLVLYEGDTDSNPLFASGTMRIDRKCRTMLYMTGVLSIYHPDTGEIYWSRGTQCNEDSHYNCFKSMGLVFVADGNVVLYDAKTGIAEWAAF